MTTTGLFESTLGDQNLDEALANLELDARLYGWPRAEVRACASRIRLRFARKRDPR